MSDKQGFTPGPWKWSIEDYSCANLQGPDGEMQHVLSSSPCKSCRDSAAEPRQWEWGRCTTPSIADARLIEASPALYEMLKKIGEETVCVCRLNKVVAPFGSGIPCRKCEIDAALLQARPEGGQK